MKTASYLLFIGLVLLLLTSCAGPKVDAMKGGAVQNGTYRDFIGTEEQVWVALINALSKEEVIKAFDCGKGLVVTDYRTVAGKEVQTKTPSYKYSYTVNVLPQQADITGVRVQVTLRSQHADFYKREGSDIEVERSLTRDLFTRICRSLPSGSGKSSGCSDYQAKSNPSQKQAPYISRQASSQKLTGNPQTRSVQQRLLDLGYAPGKVDGKMGKKTRKAIMRFQNDKGLPAHSKLDRKTLQALGVNGVPEPVPQPVADKKTISSSQDSLNSDKRPEQTKPAAERQKRTETAVPRTPASKKGSRVRKSVNEYRYITLSPTIVKKEDNVMADTLGKIAENSDIKVLREGTTWYTIRFKNQTGYVLAALVDKRKKEASAGKQGDDDIFEEEASAGKQDDDDVFEEETSAGKQGEDDIFEEETFAGKQGDDDVFEEEVSARKQREDRKKGTVPSVTEQQVKTVPAVQKQTPAPEPEPFKTGTVNAVTHLYAKPSVISSKYVKLDEGETVEIYGEQKGFYQVKINDREGFVYKDFVDIGK